MMILSICMMILCLSSSGMRRGVVLASLAEAPAGTKSGQDSPLRGDAAEAPAGTISGQGRGGSAGQRSAEAPDRHLSAIWPLGISHIAVDGVHLEIFA